VNYRGTDPDPTRVRCSFYVRTPSDKHPGMFDYTDIVLNHPTGDGNLHVLHPPAVGDIIPLTDVTKKFSGRFKVLAREWGHASYGSTYWPLLDAHPTHGPMLYLLVEPSEDFFHNQAPRDDDDEPTDTEGGSNP
jgi:hypothetical protein